MNESRKPIVVVGSINMDLVAHTHQIPVPGQTVIGTGFDTTPGGKGANQAVAVARLGYPVQMVGMVGDDVFGQALLDNLANAGVGTEAVARVSGPSGVAPILVAESGERAGQCADDIGQPASFRKRDALGCGEGDMHGGGASRRRLDWPRSVYDDL